MKTFRLTIRCDSAAFDPDPAFEVASIIQRVADCFVRGSGAFPAPTILIDANGNIVGEWSFTESDPA